MLWLLDKDEHALRVLDNDSPGGTPYWDDDHYETLAGELTYDFMCPGDVAEAVIGNMVLFQDLDGVGKLCRIITVDDSSDGTKTVHSESSHTDLIGYVVRPVTYTSQTVATILAGILTGTPWQAGQVDWDGILTAEYTDYPTALEALKSLESGSSLEVRYRVEFDGSVVTGRYVDMLSEIGSDTGKVIEYAKDIIGLKRTGGGSGLCSAMVGVGKSKADGTYTTFSSVVWSVADGDPVDKPAGQDWVGSPDLLQLYGHCGAHVTGKYADADCDDAGALLTKTWAALNAAAAAAYTYDVSAVLLDRAPRQYPWQNDDPYAHEAVRLGDTVHIRDLSFTPPCDTDVRVTEMHRSYTDPTAGSGTYAR